MQPYEISTSEEEQSSSQNKQGCSVGVLIGVVIAAVVLAATGGVLAVVCCCKDPSPAAVVPVSITPVSLTSTLGAVSFQFQGGKNYVTQGDKVVGVLRSGLERLLGGEDVARTYYFVKNVWTIMSWMAERSKTFEADDRTDSAKASIKTGFHAGSWQRKSLRMEGLAENADWASFVEKPDLGYACRRHQRAVWIPNDVSDIQAAAADALAVLKDSGLKLVRYKIKTLNKNDAGFDDAAAVSFGSGENGGAAVDFRIVDGETEEAMTQKNLALALGNDWIIPKQESQETWKESQEHWRLSWGNAVEQIALKRAADSL